MKIIGLTGGIATGKSTVSKMLQARSFPVIDADEVVRELQAPGMPLLHEIATLFGPDILDSKGYLNRKMLGQLIFTDDQARKRLDDLVHPQVQFAIKQKISECKVDTLFLDVPLLFEAGFDILTDINVVVWTSGKEQCERLMKRDHITEIEALQRIKSQMPIDEKAKRADLVIDNSGTLEELEGDVERILKGMILK